MNRNLFPPKIPGTSTTDPIPRNCIHHPLPRNGTGLGSGSGSENELAPYLQREKASQEHAGAIAMPVPVRLCVSEDSAARNTPLPALPASRYDFRLCPRDHFSIP